MAKKMARIAWAMLACVEAHKKVEVAKRAHRLAMLGGRELISSHFRLAVCNVLSGYHWRMVLERICQGPQEKQHDWQMQQ